MKEWFILNKNKFCLGLSFDGLPDAHSMNRSNSFDLIDLDFFLNNWPEQPIKMTISQDSLPLLADGIIFLQKKGFKINANLAMGVYWDVNLIKNFSNQLNKLMDFYLANPSYTPVSILDMKLFNILDETTTQKKFCGMNNYMVTVDTDGQEYPCHMFTPLVLNKNQILNLRSLNLNDSNTYHNEKCNDCIIQKICPTCYGLNFKFTDKISERDLNYCQFMKIQVLANCKFQAKKLQNSTNDDINHYAYLTAKSILKINKLLNNMEESKKC